MEEVHNHYLEFLGINIDDLREGKRIFKSKYRDLPLNEKYYYPIIVSNYFGDKVLSVSPKYYNEVKNISKDDTKSIDEVLEDFLKKHLNLRLRKMHRYVYENNDKKPTISHKMSMEDIKRMDMGENFDHEKYMKRKRAILEDKRQFIVDENNKIASIGFISEVRCGGGNIVVMTIEGYRNKGYGKEVVKGCINWCLDRNILPIYLVEDSNIFSRKIPEALGFKKIAKEWIVSD